ncbi:MAG: DUF389 domain-containing protein [Saprospiraceae bacterium]|nr:DUF389 domain-containing protein [Saprospiraceae bacterium]
MEENKGNQTPPVQGNNNGDAPSGEGQSQDRLKQDFTGLLGSLRDFLKEIFDIREKTDKETTQKMIIEDVPFKGHTAWILVCSILVASVGLNANSAPVIIGAMLISPLMGPILGIGLSIAINDIDTLRRALTNFLVMVVLSVLTAFLFFKVFPLREESSELLARTAPDIRDVLIAFFGGLALIIARTKKGTIASVIFGVAIATALMPPLCTAGFGLAIGKYSYFWGAMYLFTINTIFIGLATYLMLKLLRFRMVRYANSVKRKRIAQIVSLTALLVMIPALWTFYNVFQESLYMKQARSFVDKVVKKTELPKGGVYLHNLTEINYRRDSTSTIDLYFMGDDAVPDHVEATWENTKNSDYSKLKNTILKIEDGAANEAFEQMNYLQELYDSKKIELESKESQIKVLEREVNRLMAVASKSFPINQWANEARANYPEIQEMGYYYFIKARADKLDTIPVFTVNWKAEADSISVQENMKKIRNWLVIKTNLSDIILEERN